jgi:hypothetical protein
MWTFMNVTVALLSLEIPSKIFVVFNLLPIWKAISRHQTKADNFAT